MATGTLTLAWLLLSASALPSDVWPLNQPRFEIPFRIDEARRAEIKELLLFCSIDQGATWQQVAVSAPDKSGFQYAAPSDGLYWFSVCVVDRQNKREPADIYKSPPGQKVLVDTLKPTLRLLSAERHGDDIVVGWEIQEDYPDLTSLKLEYRTPEAPPWLWTAAPISPLLSGQGRFRPSQPGVVSIRIQVADQAGNIAQAQTDLPAPPGVAGTLAAAPPVGGPASTPLPPPPATMTPAAPAASVSGVPSPPPPSPPLPGTPGNSPWERSNTVQPTALTQGEQRSPSSRGGPLAAGGADPGTRWVATSEIAGGLPRASADVSGSRPPAGASPSPQLTNNSQISLDYQATPGPSGIGKVELWVTTDDGRTWRPWAEDPDQLSPIVFDLPADGIYGFTLVVYSRAGRGRTPPQPGEPPQMRVELDTTPPECRPGTPVPDPRRRDALVIPYTITDRNLPPGPGTLEWAERPDGTWHTIATDLPASGRYTWVVPPKMPAINVYLRLLARDSAGNTNVAQTVEPVSIDMTEPEARILGLAGTARKP